MSLYKIFPKPQSLERTRELRAGTNERYQPFIVLTAARSGSEFFCSRLESHPNVLMSREVFHAGGIFLLGSHVTSSYARWSRDLWPVDFARRYLFRAFSGDVGAIGFKLFYEHLERMPRGARFAFLDYLRREQRVKVIQLRRRNLLRVYLSHEIARKSGVYSNRRSTEQRTGSVIKVDIDHCLRYLDRAEALRASYNEAFADCDSLQVEYETMVSSPGEIDGQVSEYLGLGPSRLNSPYRRQEYRGLPEIVGNFDELSRRFSVTRWRALLEMP